MVTKRSIQKWCNALRSGKYSQTPGALQDEHGYCCLGVACDIFIPKKKQNLIEEYLMGTLPKYQKYSPEWLNTINDDFGSLTGKLLTVLNDDDDHFTFDEIADLLESVHIHEVLK